MAQLYGYVRVSTKEQNESRRLVAMKEFGVTDANICSVKLIMQAEMRRIVLERARQKSQVLEL